MSLDPAKLTEMYRRMVTIRAFIQRAAAESRAGNIPSPVQPTGGEEASAVGVCAALRPGDRITGTHRSLGHAIAKGVDTGAIMAELFGRANGCCGGKGGAMHIADFNQGMLGANGIVGGGLPIAVGAALASQMEGDGSVAVAFFGDGASNEGTFHSSLNLASIWKLPIVFVCENNGWAIAVPASYALSVEDVSIRAVSYDMPGLTVDGGDVLAVYEAAAQAVARARDGNGPSLIECKTRRSDLSDRPEPPAPPGLADASISLTDPIPAFASQLATQGIMDTAVTERIHQGVAEAIEKAVQFAASGPLPGLEEALGGVFAV
jgi:pyruvate dehydrogenase E1 component alpha subunit